MQPARPLFIHTKGQCSVARIYAKLRIKDLSPHSTSILEREYYDKDETKSFTLEIFTIFQRRLSINWSKIICVCHY